MRFNEQSNKFCFMYIVQYIVQPIKMFNTNFLLLIYGYRQNCLMSCTPKVGNFERWYFGIWCFPTIRHNLHIFSSQKSLHPTPHQQKLRPHPHHQQQVVGGSPDPVKKLSSPRNSCWLVLRFGSQVWLCRVYSIVLFRGHAPPTLHCLAAIHNPTVWWRALATSTIFLCTSDRCCLTN